MTENTAPSAGKKQDDKKSGTGSPRRPASGDKKSASKSPKRPASAGKKSDSGTPNKRPISADKKSGSGSPKRPASPNRQSASGSAAIPLGQRENNRNQFNLAKARADAAAAQASAGSRASTYTSSRRQSGSSQVSLSSKASNRSGLRAPRGKKKKYGHDDREIMQVFNESGKDVTPKSLVSLKPTVLLEKMQSTGMQSAQDSDFESSVPIYSRTGFSVTSTAGSITPETVELEPEIDQREDGQESRRSRSFKSSILLDTPRYPKRRVVVVSAPIVTPTLEKELEKIVAVHVTESPNFVLLNLRGNNLNMAFETINKVLDRNSRYEKLLEFKQGSDNYSDGISQTMFSLIKSKEVQASALSTQSDAVQVNSWDIADSIAGKVKPDAYEPWKVVGHGSKEKVTNPTTTVVILPELFTYWEGPNAPLSPLPSPPASRRQSVSGGLVSRRGSTSGGFSRRPSASGGQISRRGSTSVASRRPSTSGGTVGLEDFLRAMSPGSDIHAELGSAAGSNGAEGKIAQQADLGKLTGLLKALEVVERALVQNTYHDQLLSYRNFRPREFAPVEEPLVEADGKAKVEGKTEKKSTPPPPPPPPAEETEEKPEEVVPTVVLPATVPSITSLHSLWAFECDVTEGRNISCMTWNKVNKNLLAVGYGQFEFGSQRDGMIAFWSLKNPRYPHAAIATKSGVTALDFAASSPSLLAVGFYDGNLAIYDARNPKDVDPIVKSGVATGKHSDPIWKLQWIDSTSEHGESLVSISTDGRVSQWSIKKDLEYVNLMKLKKAPSQNRGAQPQPFISRRAAGLCFDFSPKDPGVYLVGTEEGRIYKCDRSYNEQYMQTYVGHNGPVYQVRWSPFLSYLFLSCSSDWTVRLWSEEQESALLVFQTTNVSVADVRWSISNSCVFGLVSTDGHLEVWDMQISVMKPVLVHLIENCTLSCLLFSEESPILLLSGSTGSISIVRLEGFVIDDESVEVQKLKDSLVANVTRHGGT